MPTATADSVVAMFLLVQGGVGDESASLDKGEHYDFTTNASTPVLIYSLQPAVVSLVTPSGHTSGTHADPTRTHIVHARTYARAHTHVHTHARAHAHICARARAHTHTHTHVHAPFGD